MSINSTRDKVVFTVNSANRISGTPFNFMVRLNIDNNQGYDKVCILSAIISKTWYQIQNNNNTFTLIELGTPTIITIPIGTYTRDSFAATLTGLLNASSPNHWIYTVIYPNIRTQPETGLFTYNVSGNGGNQPQFVFGKDSIHNQMGFHPNSTYFFSSNLLTSNHVCNFSSEPCVFIKSDICYNAVSADNILAVIYTAGFPYNSFVSYTNYTPEFNSKVMVNHNSIYNFYITDNSGIPLDTNGIDNIFTVMLYKSNKINSLIEKYIKFSVNKKDTAVNENE